MKGIFCPSFTWSHILTLISKTAMTDKSILTREEVYDVEGLSPSSKETHPVKDIGFFRTAASRLMPLASLASPIIFNAMIREVAEVSTIIFVGRTGGAVPIGAATLGNMMCNITGLSHSHSAKAAYVSQTLEDVHKIELYFSAEPQDSPSPMACVAPWTLSLAKHTAQNCIDSPVSTHKGLRSFLRFPQYPSQYSGKVFIKKSTHVYIHYSSWSFDLSTGPRHKLFYSMAWRYLLKLLP